MKFTISQHAAERWIERCQPHLTLDHARDAIRAHAKAIEAALGVGCKCVRLGCGARLILDRPMRQIVTVLPAPPKYRNGVAVAKRATQNRKGDAE